MSTLFTSSKNVTVVDNKNISVHLQIIFETNADFHINIVIKLLNIFIQKEII